MVPSSAVSHRGFTYRYAWIPARAAPVGEPPIVFVGGAFQSLESWGRFAEAFASRTGVLLVDLPGTGSTDPVPPEFGLDFLADALRRVLDELRLPAVYLVGASYGSPVVYRFAQKYPDRVSRHVLAGVMDDLTDSVRTALTRGVALARAGEMADFADLTVRHLMCTDPSLVVSRRGAVEKAMRRGLMRMSRDDVHRFVWNTERLLGHPPLDLSRPPEIPALVFTGAHDPFTPPDRCRRVAEHIPGARFATIAAADHLFHMECFDETLGLLMNFATASSTDARS